jgi:hypothetical protein
VEASAFAQGSGETRRRGRPRRPDPLVGPLFWKSLLTIANHERNPTVLRFALRARKPGKELEGTRWGGLKDNWPKVRKISRGVNPATTDCLGAIARYFSPPGGHLVHRGNLPAVERIDSSYVSGLPS